MTEKKAMTPGDLVKAVLGSDPKTIISAIRGKRAKRLGKKIPPDKYKKRTLKMNKDGKPVVSKTEYTKAHLDKEKVRKAAAKKDEKAKKSKKEA